MVVLNFMSRFQYMNLKRNLLKFPIMLACGAICCSNLAMLQNLVCTKMLKVEMKVAKTEIKILQKD